MRACLIGLVFSSLGCGTALQYIPVHPAPHKVFVRAAEQVELFMAARPTRPFVEVGLVESQQERYSLDPPAAVLAKMREFAGQCGCEGLVIFAGNDASAASEATGADNRRLEGYRGSCIVYTQAPVPAAAASAGCVPNATLLCYGPGGCRGGQSCTADGNAYTACDCGQSAPPPTAAD